LSNTHFAFCVMLFATAMANVSVLFYVESRYKINRKRLKKSIERTLDENGVKSPVEVSVAIVGDRKMTKLNKKYRGKEGTTNILSFPISEGEKTPLPQDDIVRLGDIVISYPMLIQESAHEEMLVDDRADMLIQHGLLHLMGIHHR
jgi:probable rRNA maturation factor